MILPRISRCINVEFFQVICSTSQARGVPLKTAFDVSRKKIMWMKRRCEEGQNPCREEKKKEFSAIPPLSSIVRRFLFYEADARPAAISDGYWWLSFSVTRCKVSSSHYKHTMCYCVHPAEAVAMLNHCYLIIRWLMLLVRWGGHMWKSESVEIGCMGFTRKHSASVCFLISD